MEMSQISSESGILPITIPESLIEKWKNLQILAFIKDDYLRGPKGVCETDSSINLENCEQKEGCSQRMSQSKQIVECITTSRITHKREGSIFTTSTNINYNILKITPTYIVLFEESTHTIFILFNSGRPPSIDTDVYNEYNDNAIIEAKEYIFTIKRDDTKIVLCGHSHGCVMSLLLGLQLFKENEFNETYFVIGSAPYEWIRENDVVLVETFIHTGRVFVCGIQSHINFYNRRSPVENLEIYDFILSHSRYHANNDEEIEGKFTLKQCPLYLLNCGVEQNKLPNGNASINIKNIDATKVVSFHFLNTTKIVYKYFESIEEKYGSNDATQSTFLDVILFEKNMSVTYFHDWNFYRDALTLFFSQTKKGGRKWSKKYKKSINCRRPKGFSQRQHCKYGRGQGTSKGNRRRKINRTLKQKLQKGGNPDIIRKIRKIKEIFDEEIYDITYDTVNKEYKIFTKGNNNLCVAFTIENENILYIEKLSKCVKSGTDTLDKMDSLAKKLGMGELHLVDGSGINDCGVNVSLSKLLILATGESWYNKMGYKSENDDIEKEVNEEIRKRNVNQFITECIEAERQRLKKKKPLIRYKRTLSGLTINIEKEENSEKREDLQKRIVTLQQTIAEYNEEKEHDKIDAELNNIQDVFNEGILFTINESMTVQDYFQNVNSQLKSMASSDDSTKCDKFRFASKLLNIIGNKGDIKYSIDLTKKVT
jgi:hypothetical protein